MSYKTLSISIGLKKGISVIVVTGKLNFKDTRANIVISDQNSAKLWEGGYRLSLSTNMYLEEIYDLVFSEVIILGNNLYLWFNKKGGGN